MLLWLYGLFIYLIKKNFGKATGVTGLKYFQFSDPLPLVLLLVHR